MLNCALKTHVSILKIEIMSPCEFNSVGRDNK